MAEEYTTNEKDSANEIFTQFQNANSFKVRIKLNEDIERCVLFENGKQWSMDKDIEEFPKITLNIIKQIGKARKSNVMQNEYSYLVDCKKVGNVRKIQDFLKYISNNLRLKSYDLKALNDEYTKGTAIGYFYWDAEKHGFMNKSGGEIRYEIIDIRNFAVADPYIQNIQDQEWVIFNTREKINALNNKYNLKARGIELYPDGNKYTSSTEPEPVADNSDNELVNVYTKFYRNEDGEVLFVITTETEVLKKATPINPYYVSKEHKTKLAAMPNTTSLFDEKELSEEDRERIVLAFNDKRSGQVWNLYPFVRLCFNERDNNFYGYSVINEYISVQKSINNHFALYDKALQDNVVGGFVYDENVLINQNIDACATGQMISLRLPMGRSIGDVFQRMPIANIPQGSFNYSETLINTIKSVTGTTNVQFGQADYSGQSGKQTQLLLQRAQENASDNAMLFNEYKIDQAYIMFLFAKFYYSNEEFSIVEHGMQKDNARTYEGENAFKGPEYFDDNVRLDIKVGSAPSFSEYTNIELLGQMVQTGMISFEVYVTMLPEGYISNRDEILELLKNSSDAKIKQLTDYIKQQNDIIKQMYEATKELKEDKDNITTIVDKNQKLESMLAETVANFIGKSQENAQKYESLMADMQKVLGVFDKMNVAKQK